MPLKDQQETGGQREHREYSFFMRDDEKKEDYREEPICRRRNGADQKTANYLCDGKIIVIDFAQNLM